MHRVLGEIPGTSALRTTRRYASTAPARKTRPKNQDGDKYKLSEVWTKRVINASARNDGKPGWTHQSTPQVEERRLKTAASNVARLPSLEKTEFFSEASTSEFGTDVYEPDHTKKFPPGTFVELRRNSQTTHAVVMTQGYIGGRELVSSLTTQGDIWAHPAADILFAVPAFVEKDLLSRCGIHDETLQPHEVAARVLVLKAIRRLEKAVETEYNLVSKDLADIYEKVKSKDPEAWSEVTTSQAVSIIRPGLKTIPIPLMFAVHKHLMRRSGEFTAHPTDFINNHTFRVRPQSHITLTEQVSKIIHNHDPCLDDFVKKARDIVSQSRARSIASFSEPPSQEPGKGPKFTKTDQAIIRFLMMTELSGRSTQKDPHSVLVSTILKRVGMFEQQEQIDEGVLFQFLNQLGITAPWHDFISRDRMLDLPYEGRAAEIEQEREVQTRKAISALPMATPSQPLGPNDLYSHDPLHAIRHDFGNLPVFVIDDVGAKELDDGLSIERIPSEPGNVWLHVHIADPTAILPPTHMLAKAAHQKLETQYLIHRSFPMLPQALTEKTSLGAKRGTGEPENTMSISCKLNAKGEILDYKVRAGLVRNVCIMRYNSVDKALGLPKANMKYPFGDASPSDLGLSSVDAKQVKDLRALNSVAISLVNNRLKQGFFAFNSEQVTMSLIDNNFPEAPLNLAGPTAYRGFPRLRYTVESAIDMNMGSRFIVAECMKLTCRIASIFFRDRGIPAIRRIGGIPTFEQEDGLEHVLQARDAFGFVPLITTLTAGVIPCASTYSLAPGAHFSLGIAKEDGYTRVTSPLRRFSDIVAHWQIKQALLAEAGLGPSKNPIAFSEDWLTSYLGELQMKEKQTRYIVKAHNTYWALRRLERWMSDPRRGKGNVPDPLENLVATRIAADVKDLRRQNLRAKVVLPSLGLRATLVRSFEEAKTPFELGESMRVKIHNFRLDTHPDLEVVPR